MKNLLFEFWKQKEIEAGRTITIKEVSEATGVNRDTLTRFIKGKMVRFDEDVMSKLCKYFNVPPGPVPFLVYEPEGLDKEES